MGKSIRRFGVGLALGALAAHYLQTDKGQQLLTKVKKGLAAYQEDPEHYQDLAKNFISSKLTDWQDSFHEGEMSLENSEEAVRAEVDDIIITYSE